MSVTAKQLSKSGARGKDLDGVVRDHLQIIDDKLLRAVRSWGRNVVVHDLPTVMSLPGLDKKDAQRIVYSTILRSLDQRGFETRILLEADTTKVFIIWTTDLDVEEIEAMNKLIRAKRVQRDQVEAFIQRGAPRGAATGQDRGAATGQDRAAATGQDRAAATATVAAEPALLGSDDADG
jgi:hypothetical protein